MPLTVGLSFAALRVLIGLFGVGISLARADFGQGATLTNEIFKSVAGGVLGDFVYDSLKGGGASALEELAKRFKEGGGEKLNHDLQRAAKKAQLTATLLAVRACLRDLRRERAGGRSFWPKLFHPAARDEDEKWLSQVAQLWQKKIADLPRQVPPDLVDADEIIRLFDPKLFETPEDGAAAEARLSLVVTLRDDALAEVRTERYTVSPLPQFAYQRLEATMKNGWDEAESEPGGRYTSLNLSAPGAALVNAGKQFDWFSLLCGFFNEEYRTNPGVEAAMQKYLLLDIRDRQGGAITDADGRPAGVSLFFAQMEQLGGSFAELKELMRSIGGKQDQVLAFVQGFVEENRRLHALTLASLKEESSKIQQAVRDEVGKLQGVAAPRRARGPSHSDDRAHDQTWTSLEQLGVADAGDEEIGLSLIKACNEAAKLIFRRRVKQAEQSPVPHLWDGIWREADFTGQRYYVRLADSDGVNIDFRVQQTLADCAEASAPCKLWIVGPAGVGKTTVLYRSYFKLIGAVEEEIAEARYVPVPMLLQPRNIKAGQVQRLDRQKDADSFLRLMLEFWMENRRISVPPERKTAVLSSLEHHLRRGSIAILIDGFDELNRMDFQTSIFESFFETVEHFVCATRPETDIHQATHKVINLAPVWDFKTIKSYLNDRLPESRRPAVRPFLAHLSRYDKDEWLRTPRNLNIILGLMERMNTPAAPEQVLLSALEKGEYRMHEEAYRGIQARLRRLSDLDSQLVSCPDIGEKIWSCFEQIAEQQLNTGAFVLQKAEQTDIWSLMQRARGDFLDIVTTGDTVEFRLQNFNLIDFFLTKKLAGQIRGRAPLTFCHLWSDSQLGYLSEELRREPSQPGDLVKNIWNKLEGFRLPPLDAGQGYRERPQSAARRFGAINLVQLALRIERDLCESAQGRGSARPCVEVSGKNLQNLYLNGIDLGDVTFRGCRFDGSSLAGANLERATFWRCDFFQTDFRDANAAFAAFDYCRFDFDDDAYAGWYEHKPSAVSGMLIQGARLRGGDGYDLETFGRKGAKRFKTRYVGRFWEVFSKKQESLVGAGLHEAEDDYYVPAIKEYLSTLPADRPVYLIDLMAGGSNARLRELMTGLNARGRRVRPHFDNLHVLAVDRETAHLVEVKQSLGDRFAIMPKNIEGAANLAEGLSQNFDGQPRQADLIVGKKALHELRAPLQQELLAECAQTLKPGGRLILFTDSPVSMSPEGYERLLRHAEPLRAPAPTIPELRRRLIDELRFGATDDDCAIFSNLWVLVKDWANHNEHELKNRYFSSIREIARWGEEAGLRAVGEPRRANYTLQARLFNEQGINEVGHYLDQNDNRILPADKERLIECLQGSDEYQFFCDFAEAHLWDSKSNGPSPLGVALSARRKPVSFGEIHEALSELSLSYSAGVAFEFSVHVIVFEKPAGAATRTTRPADPGSGQSVQTASVPRQAGETLHPGKS